MTLTHKVVRRDGVVDVLENMLHEHELSTAGRERQTFSNVGDYVRRRHDVDIHEPLEQTLTPTDLNAP